MHNMTPHALATTIRTALAAFKGNIYQKHIFFELSYPTLKKIYKFKGAT
jgi:hypothetical protein